MLLKLLQNTPRTEVIPEVIALLAEEGLDEEFSHHAIPVFKVGLTRNSLHPRKLLSAIAYAKTFKPDLIQGWMYHGNAFATLLHRLVASRSRLFLNVRASLDDIHNERFTTRLCIRSNAYFSSGVEKVIFNSHASLKHHLSIGFKPEKSIVIPNGFDTNSFAPDRSVYRAMRESLQIPSDALVVGMIARFHPMKAHTDLIAACAKVHQTVPNCFFILVGRGINASNSVVNDVINATGCKDRFRLIDVQKNIRPYMQMLDVGVLSSAWGEAFPNVLGELMACGVPCVATDVGDVRRIIDQFGKVTAPHEPESLAKNIIELLRLPAHVRQALGASARKSIIERFSLEAISTQYLTCYRSIARP